MMRGILFSLLVGLSLCGCTTNAGIKTVFVDRPVITVEKCIKKEDVPVRPQALKDGPHPTTLDQALGFAEAKVSEWTRYGDKTDVIVKGCTI